MQKETWQAKENKPIKMKSGEKGETRDVVEEELRH